MLTQIVTTRRTPRIMPSQKTTLDLPEFSLSQTADTPPAQLHFHYIPKSIFPLISPVIDQIQTRINDYLKTTYRKMLADFEADRAENEAIKQDALIYAVTAIASVMEWHAENLARFKAWRTYEVEKAQQAEAIWRESAEVLGAENLALRETLEHISKLKTVGEVRAAVKEALGK